MRLAIFAFVCLLVVVIAVPLEIEIETGEKHLQKRGTDTMIAEVVKAALAFGAFIWGGGIIFRRGINYYFEKKEKIEREKMKHELMVAAKIIKEKPLPMSMESPDDPK
jgi:hypothetical protein